MHGFQLSFRQQKIIPTAKINTPIIVIIPFSPTAEVSTAFSNSGYYYFLFHKTSPYFIGSTSNEKFSGEM
ncbi:MAG: hypothetical protein PUE73_02830 [Eubacteriales bacterium]|nr:hypothetical protein [Eubacteriales bacterium]